MSSKAKFLDSYEMRLVNEFKLNLLYFASSHADPIQGFFTVIIGSIPIVHKKTGKCFFSRTFN